MHPLLNQYVELCIKIQNHQLEDPEYVRSEAFDILYNQIDQVWALFNNKERNEALRLLKEKSPATLTFTQEQLGLLLK